MEVIECDPDATLEEVYCIPATSEILLQKIEVFEQREIINEKIITLQGIITGYYINIYMFQVASGDTRGVL